MSLVGSKLWNNKDSLRCYKNKLKSNVIVMNNTVFNESKREEMLKM